MPKLTPTRLRARIEADIERLIAMLDAIDGDAETEPSLAAWHSPFSGRAVEVDLEGDYSDYEPGLGWPEQHPGVPTFGFALG